MQEHLKIAQHLVLPKKKTSTEQLGLLVNFISANRILLHGKTKPSEAASIELERLWDKLTVLLNSCRSGPTKKKAQWKKTFIDWKCHTKKKARDILNFSRQTGSVGDCRKILTPIEKRLISIIRSTPVEGTQDIADLELPAKCEIEIEIPSTTVDEAIENDQTTASEPNETYEKLHMKSPEIDDSSSLKIVDTYTDTQGCADDEMFELVKVQAASDDIKRRELDLKEEEIGIRMLEMKNKEKELELRERELVLRETYAESQKCTKEILELLRGQVVSNDIKKRELDLKERELGIRLSEVKNNEKELELKERELIVRELEILREK